MVVQILQCHVSHVGVGAKSAQSSDDLPQIHTRLDNWTVQWSPASVRRRSCGALCHKASTDTVNFCFLRSDFIVALCAHHTVADVYEKVGLVKVTPFSRLSDLDCFSLLIQVIFMACPSVQDESKTCFCLHFIMKFHWATQEYVAIFFWPSDFC